MQKECVYVANTPLGDCCTIANKECTNLCAEECSEPKWDYFKSIAEEYMEEEE